MRLNIPARNEWPETSDGTTDWEVLFEEEGTGLVAIVSASETSEQLKQLAEGIIRVIFNRDRDKATIRKVMAYLNKLIPDGAGPERLPVMIAGTNKLLRKIKDDRIKRATAFVAKKKKKAKRNKPGKKTERRTNAFMAFFLTNNVIKLAFVLVIAGLMPLGIYFSYPSKKAPEGDVLEHMRLIEDQVYHRLQFDSWSIQSVMKGRLPLIS